MRRRNLKKVMVLPVLLASLVIVAVPALAANLDGTDVDDAIRGSDEDDRIRGFGGRDRLTGVGGNDRIVGGTGSDFMRGGDGDDSIDAVDGSLVSDTVHCGQGTRDSVVADFADYVHSDCEGVRREGSTGPGEIVPIPPNPESDDEFVPVAPEGEPAE